MKIVVISLGGSVIVPASQKGKSSIQIKFLKKFRRLILKFLKKKCRFIIITGGGNICREYQNAASQIIPVSDEDKDWLGIHATRLNAHLLRTIFKKVAYPVVLDNPQKPIQNEKNYQVFIASGWRPGWSTDYIAVLLAQRFKVDKIINASNISYVHEKDNSSKPIKEISWKNYRKLISSKWKPGLRVPFDPIATRLASKLKLKVIVTKGTDLKNLENILEDKKFKGTLITP